MKVIISGGGTGGHIYPAIAIADAIKKIKPKTDILFVGALGKMEMEKVPSAGYEIKGLRISGLQRKLTWKNLSFPFKLLNSLWNARKIIRDFKPDIVVGVGGYASGPLGRVAAFKNIPLVLQEQNSFPGLTNRWLAKYASKIFVAFQGMEKYFGHAKVCLIGNPVRNSMRAELLLSKKAEAENHFRLDPDKRTLLLFGGSLGARALNNNMRDAYQWLANHKDIQIIWQTGKLYFEEMQNSSTAKLPNVRLVEFIDRMDLAYAAADLVISRAGALTIAELTLVEKPALLIPSPNVAEDHQSKNARALLIEKAAEMMNEEESKFRMLVKAYEILQEEHKISEMAKNLKRIALPDAAIKIAEKIIEMIDR